MSSLPATIHVYTFRRGLLARLGHDLRLRVTRFHVRLEADAVRASFDTGSLVVDGAMVQGRLDPSQLSANDKANIEQAIRDEVLRHRTFPTVGFEGSVRGRSPDKTDVQGTLSLAGRSRAQSLTLTRRKVAPPSSTETSPWTGRVELVPTAFGIEPYRALGGALKLEDRVVVELELTAPEAIADEPLDWGTP